MEDGNIKLYAEEVSYQINQQFHLCMDSFWPEKIAVFYDA